MNVKEDVVDEIMQLQKEIGKTSYSREQLETADILHLIVVKEWFLDVIRGEI